MRSAARDSSRGDSSRSADRLAVGDVELVREPGLAGRAGRAPGPIDRSSTARARDFSSSQLATPGIDRALAVGARVVAVPAEDRVEDVVARRRGAAHRGLQPALARRTAAVARWCPTSRTIAVLARVGGVAGDLGHQPLQDPHPVKRARQALAGFAVAVRPARGRQVVPVHQPSLTRVDCTAGCAIEATARATPPCPCPGTAGARPSAGAAAGAARDASSRCCRGRRRRSRSRSR